MNQPTQKEIVQALYASGEQSLYQFRFALADRIVAEGIAPPTVDCNTCINRGNTDGLSQETHCDHCIFSVSYLTNHYAPKPEVK